jgi:AcrR family transcriptional regulator
MTESLAQRRRELFRDELRSIAVNLFADNGFDAVTVGDIAASAGMSERTFFRYFASKDEVILDYERQVRQRLIDTLTARPRAEGPVAALREAYLATSHVEPGHRARVARLGRILAEAPRLRARADGERLDSDDPLVTEIARRFRARKVAQATRLAGIVVTAMDAVAGAEFRQWAVDGGDDDPAERIASAIRVLENGLSALSE